MTIEETKRKMRQHKVQFSLQSRLRGQHWIPGVDFTIQAIDWMVEAADEIDRLQRTNATLVNNIQRRHDQIKAAKEALED